MNVTEKLLRLAVRLAPREFRERYGADCIETHRARAADTSARGRLAAWRFSLLEVFGAMRMVAVLRFGGQRDHAHLGGNGGRARAGSSSSFETMLQDLRFARRTLGRNPGYTMMAVVVLALGIGASAAIFSAVNSFFFRPLPFADADRLAMLFETNPEFGWVDTHAAPANMLDWRERVDAFADVAAYSDMVGRIPFIDDGEPTVLEGVSVTGNFFAVLGVPAALGRTFTWEETWDGADDVVVLSHAAWTTRFGSDPGVIGRTYEFGANSARVIGVMPAGFSYPSAETKFWYSYGWAPINRELEWFRRAHFVRAVARLAPGVTHEQANAELQAVVRQLQTEYPETNSVMGAGMMPLRDFLIRDVRRPLLILLGAVGLLLLLACANVANLTLVRGAARGRELSLRHALGASRLRVVRQLMTESVVLAGIGGAIGIAIGWVAVRAMSALTPLGIDGATSIALDTRVVLFTLAATLASGMLFGLVPALRSTAGGVHGALKEGGRGGSPGRASGRAVGAIVVAEVAIALLLIIGAGLMTRSFLLMRDVDPGFRTEGVLAVQFSIPSTRYEEGAQVIALQDRLVDALQGRAAVSHAGFVGELPLNGVSWTSQFQAAGWPADRVGFEIAHRRTDNGYFAALGIPLERGRLFQPGDQLESPLVVVVNETFAREHFPNEDAIGKRIAFDRVATAESNWYEIVGIVGDQHQVSPAQPVRAEVFESRHQDWARGGWLVVRTNGEAASALPVVREVLREVDPLIPIAQTRTLQEVWRASMAREEFILTLLSAFGALALLLAAAGIYGVTAQAVRRRTHEIGIRMALGARAADVLRLILGRSMAVVGIGLAAGLVVSLVTMSVMSNVLFGIAPTDPATLATVILALAAVAALASYVPARRAMVQDPVRSLKEE